MDQVPRGTWSVTNQTAFASVLFPAVTMISCNGTGDRLRVTADSGMAPALSITPRMMFSR
jgi:hypothetical protein